MILNPWDVQSKHIHTDDGIMSALYSGECCWGGGEAYVLVKLKSRQGNDIPENDRMPFSGSASGILQRTGRI